MSVAKENSRNHMGRVSLDDLIEVISPSWSGICAVPYKALSVVAPTFKTIKKDMQDGGGGMVFSSSQTSPSKPLGTQTNSCQSTYSR